MRLIDADNIIYPNDTKHKASLKRIIELQDTAYDVDKVIESLKRLQEDGMPMRTAINFVKSGGDLSKLD